MLAEVLDLIRAHNARQKAHPTASHHSPTPTPTPTPASTADAAAATAGEPSPSSSAARSELERIIERNEFWYPLFQSYFYECEVKERDDLLFFVVQNPPIPSAGPAPGSGGSSSGALGSSVASSLSASPSPSPAPSSDALNKSTSSLSSSASSASSTSSSAPASSSSSLHRQGSILSKSASAPSTPPIVSEPFFVRRRTLQQQQPLPFDRSINWEETFYLNLILNQFEYSLTVAICKTVKAEPTNPASNAPLRDRLIIHKKVTQRVYPSPSKRKMESGKAEETELTYPQIYFTMDGFDEIFSEVYIIEGENLCIEMVTWPHGDTKQRTTVFQGSVSYGALLNAYQLKVKKTTPLYLSLLSRTRSDMEFLMLRGPGGKGEAQVAMSKYQAAAATAASSPSLSSQPSSAATTPTVSPSSPSLHNASADAASSDTPTATTEVKRLANWSLGILDSAMKKVQTYAANKKMQLEQKGQAPTLNAFLTFISLPWDSLARDVVQHTAKPVLETLPESTES